MAAKDHPCWPQRRKANAPRRNGLTIENASSIRMPVPKSESSDFSYETTSRPHASKSTDIRTEETKRLCHDTSPCRDGLAKAVHNIERLDSTQPSSAQRPIRFSTYLAPPLLGPAAYPPLNQDRWDSDRLAAPAMGKQRIRYRNSTQPSSAQLPWTDLTVIGGTVPSSVDLDSASLP